MSAGIDEMPAFWMRRSRRARKALRELRERMGVMGDVAVVPPDASRAATGERSESNGAERRKTCPALFFIASLLCAALGMGLLGEGLWIKAKAGLAQILLDRAFAASIATGKPVKPWSWADTWPVARISVPRLQASAIALAGGSGQALAFGPGHLAQTPRPGERGTSVFAAHRDTHFRFLGDLKVGDEIRITRDDGITFTYEMTGADIVRWDQSEIDAGAAGYNLALATCWPLDGTLAGPLRYVVHARLKPTSMFGGSRHIARAGLY
ncbi:class GN sortase [Nordella sp. HKS 07]|uniref:class GN sortase n=1 Tax=Nordella sp. HKS 07 TaxID=2712222 RepID=UPI00352EFEA3